VVVSSTIVAEGPAGGRIRQDVPILRLADAIPAGLGSGEAHGSWLAIIDDLASVPVSEDEGVRTNIGLVNLGKGDIVVEIAFVESLGSCLDGLGEVPRISVRLDPFEHRQLNNVIAEAAGRPLPHAIALVAADELAAQGDESDDEGWFIAYASVVDTHSNDARLKIARTASTRYPLALAPCR
jgi:hypothetical protein